MSNVSLCTECRKVGVIAPVGGPTCPHQVNAGLRWWPFNWERMEQGERIAWLAARKTP